MSPKPNEMNADWPAIVRGVQYPTIQLRLSLAIFSILPVLLGATPSHGFAVAPAAGTAQPHELLVGLAHGSVLRLRFAADVDLAAVAAEYRRRPEVRYVEPNYRVVAAAFPNDPEFARQWYLEAMAARDAWSAELLELESQRVKPAVIAVLDTGVDVDHPDLQGKIWTNSRERPGDLVDNDRNGFVDDWQGWDFVSPSPDPNPKFTSGFRNEAIHHGTVVAGLAAAASHNGKGVTGVSWTSKIMALRVLDSEGNGTVADVLRGVEYAVAQRADVINLSFVGVEYSQALYEGLKAAADAGLTIVAAAGNAEDHRSGVDLAVTPAYPVCLDAQESDGFIIGVAAINRRNQVSEFSNYGRGCVDVVAPGESIYGLLVQEPRRAGFGEAYGGAWSGTSVATPLVSGAAAVVRTLRPELSAADVRAILLDATESVQASNPRLSGKIGRGRLSLSKVVQQAIAFRPAGAGADAGLVLAGLGLGSFPQMKVFTATHQQLKSLYAYGPTFRGVVNVAGGDVTGDGIPDVVAGAGSRGGPHVRIFNLEGQVLGQFFAFDRASRTGINVAVGNIDGRGGAEIIVAPASGASPEVAVFDFQGRKLSSWLAFAPTFKGGVNVAAGDLDGDGVDEVITGAGAGGGPQVRVWSGQGKLVGQFFAFNALTRLGVMVAAGDVNGDQRDEVVAALPAGGNASVRIFRGGDFSLLSEFQAFSGNFTLGLTVATGDLNGDRVEELIVGSGVGGGPHVRIFTIRGKLEGEFFAHDATYQGGVRVGYLPQPVLRR